MQQKILFVGAGNMGGAILEAALRGGVLEAERTFVLEKNAEKLLDLQNRLGVQAGNPGDADIVILAVKPQGLTEAFPLPCKLDALLISILAGVSVAKLQNASRLDQICRAMPNTPALVNSGMTALYFSEATSQAGRTFCHDLFAACGEVIELADEDDMHAITALSGSGPAYFFHFVEALTAAGQSLGLDEEVAEKLARQTLLGSAVLLKHSQESPAVLRQRVTSPGGTTAAALDAFSASGFASVVQQALEAAAKRSRELGE